MNFCIKKGCSVFIVLMCVMGFLILINIYHAQESFGIGLDEDNLFYSLEEGLTGANVDLAVGEDGIVISSHLTGLVYFPLSNLEREKPRDISVKLNDKLVEFDQPPIIDSGRTLVPVRAMFEALGASVEWVPETRTVLSTLDGTDIVIQIDSTIATVNEAEKKLDVPSQIVGDRTLVPLRFVGESFGLEVDWIDQLRQVVLNDLPEREDFIVFSDKNLEKAIRQEINKPTGNVYLKDVSEIKVLELSDNNIEDISALSNLTSLEKLWLSDNNIADINALSKLTNLEILELSGNNIADISSLSNLTDLEMLMLIDNRITNINALSNLTNLSQLRLGKNKIADISALANLSNLNMLKIIDNNITDINALANLTNLEWLSLLNNDVTDISTLANLTNLETLRLDDNNITNISVLAEVKQLVKLSISGNKISDISVLSDLISLEYLDLRRNNIKDITPLSNLINLDRIWLDGNIVTDFTPLDSLLQIKGSDFKKGDYVQFGRYRGEPILWRVIAIEDGKPLLFSERILTLKAFSTRGDSENPAGKRVDANRTRGGSNYWKDSTLRHWLNSDKDAGQVFNDYPYNAPSTNWVQNSPYDQEAGFLANFTHGERSAIETRTHKVLLANIDSEVKDGGSEEHTSNIYSTMNMSSVVQNYDTANYHMVTDKVFLLSVKELKEYVYDNGMDHIGKPIQSIPMAVDNSTFRFYWLSSKNRRLSWTRTPTAFFSSNVRRVLDVGNISHNSAGDGTGGVRAALSLSSDVINAIGSGTAEKPYIVFGGDNPFSDATVVDTKLETEDEKFYFNIKDEENIVKVDFNRDVIRLSNKKLPLINIAIDADFKILNPFGEKNVFMFVAPVSGIYKFETTSKYNLPKIVKNSDGGVDFNFNNNDARIPISEIGMIRKQLRESFQNKEYNASIEFELEKNKLYYIDFDDYKGINFTKPYPIYLRVTLPEYTDDVGDTFETAKNILISDKQSVSHTRGFLGSESDIDFYKFTAQRSGLHTLNLSGLINMKVILYDENKNILSQSSAVLSDLELETNHFSLKFHLSKGKTYYAKVLSAQFEIGVYDLKILPPSNVPEALLLYFSRESNYTKERLYRLLYSKNSLPINEFIILSGYNIDYAKDSVISKKDIENLTIEMVGTKSYNDLDKIKQEYFSVLKKENIETVSRIRADMEGFTTISIKIAKRLLKVEPHAKIWFSIPDVTILPLARNYERTYLEYIENIKRELDKIDASYWENNVEGFYFATESVVKWYTDFDENNIFRNPLVNLMSKLSQRIRDQHSKKFVWMPYYSRSTENIKRIGIIANNTNIFDYVIIQPNTFFDEMRYPNNITYVERSIRENLVSYPNGELVSNKHYETSFNNSYNVVTYPDGALVGNKASKTLIGGVMELGNRRGDKNDDKSVKEVHLEYVNAFGKYLGKKPIAFYAEDYNYIIQDFQYKLIREFFLGQNF